MRIKPNQFKCISCGKIRIRGRNVRVEKGEDKWIEVKVCKSEKCRKAAKLGWSDNKTFNAA